MNIALIRSIFTHYRLIQLINEHGLLRQSHLSKHRDHTHHSNEISHVCAAFYKPHNNYYSE